MSSPSAGALLLLVARLFLGLVFFSSALGKFAHWNSFIQNTVNYYVLPQRVAHIFALFLPWGELVLGVALLLAIALPIAGVLALLLLLCFVVAIVLNLRRGRAIDCGCYGIVGTKTIGWGMVIRNLLLLVIVLVMMFTGPSSEFGGWIAQWHADLVMLASPSVGILFVLLLAFCFITVWLIEWAVTSTLRVARLRTHTFD